jgi:hypothetical protein
MENILTVIVQTTQQNTCRVKCKLVVLLGPTQNQPVYFAIMKRRLCQKERESYIVNFKGQRMSHFHYSHPQSNRTVMEVGNDNVRYSMEGNSGYCWAPQNQHQGKWTAEAPENVYIYSIKKSSDTCDSYFHSKMSHNQCHKEINKHHFSRIKVGHLNELRGSVNTSEIPE